MNPLATGAESVYGADFVPMATARLRAAADLQRTDEVLCRLLDQYARTTRPIQVDFRELVGWLPDKTRAAHLLHPYPAKLLMHIPHFFLANEVLSRPGDVVADPFCGSGTVLLEAALAGRGGLGWDINPLAVLIARVKTYPIRGEEVSQEVRTLHRRFLALRNAPPPDVINLEYWYYPSAISSLSRLRSVLETVSPGPARDLLLVCFSHTARKCSRCDPRLSVPVRMKDNPYSSGHSLWRKTDAHLRRLKRQDVWRTFEETVAAALDRLSHSIELLRESPPVEISQADARSVVLPHDGWRSTSLVITSPPYAGAQKYIRSSSLSLGWLGYGGSAEMRALDNRSIGREKYPTSSYERPLLTGIQEADTRISAVHARDPLRAHIAANYLLEMRAALERTHRLLRPGGHLVVVAGANRVRGREFPTHKYLTQLAVDLGFKVKLTLVDEIRGWGLMTKRNSVAGPMSREWVLLMQRV